MCVRHARLEKPGTNPGNSHYQKNTHIKKPASITLKYYYYFLAEDEVEISVELSAMASDHVLTGN